MKTPFNVYKNPSMHYLTAGVGCLMRPIMHPLYPFTFALSTCYVLRVFQLTYG